MAGVAVVAVVASFVRLSNFIFEKRFYTGGANCRRMRMAGGGASVLFANYYFYYFILFFIIYFF